MLALLTGRIAPFRAPDEPSAIVKAPVAGRVAIGPLGLAGDEQADRRYHGGPDKAIHHYPGDHYAYWRETLGGQPLLDQVGAFGENVSTHGLTERDVRIGDRFRLGTALVEVSQGRQPCWKQGHRLGDAAMVARIVVTRRSGWYYRVIEPGTAAAGDAFALVARGVEEWTVERTFALLVAGAHKRDPAGVRALAALEVLAEPWRQRAAELAG